MHSDVMEVRKVFYSNFLKAEPYVGGDLPGANFVEGIPSALSNAP